MTDAQRWATATALWLVQDGHVEEASFDAALTGITANFHSAVEKEREACAATVEAVTKAMIDWPLPGLVDANEPTKRACAAAIRARSNSQA